MVRKGRHRLYSSRFRTFNKSPAVIAKALASKKVSPKGPGSGMRMLTFYIDRAGTYVIDSGLMVNYHEQ